MTRAKPAAHLQKTHPAALHRSRSYKPGFEGRWGFTMEEGRGVEYQGGRGGGVYFAVYRRIEVLIRIYNFVQKRIRIFCPGNSRLKICDSKEKLNY